MDRLSRSIVVDKCVRNTLHIASDLLLICVFSLIPRFLTGDSPYHDEKYPHPIKGPSIRLDAPRL